MHHKISVKKEKGSEKKPASTSSRGKFKLNTAMKTKLKSHEYTYKKLNELLKKEIDRLNIYAVLLDCSGVYFSKASHKYICTVKLIDDTVNPEVRGVPDFITITMFAKNPSQLPQPAKIGSILRIHRGQTKKNKGIIQLNCDVNIKGAWTMFDPTDSVIPIDKSSKTHTFTTKDKIRLSKIREFAKDFFEYYDFLNTTFKEAEKKKMDDFDTICYVLCIKSKGIYSRLLLCDNTSVAKLNIPSNKGIHFSPLSVVRLRGACYSNSKDSIYIEFNDYSNILNVPNEYKCHKDLLSALKSKTVSENVKEHLKYYVNNSPEPLIISQPNNKRAKIVHLKELYFGDLLKSKDKFFRINANIIEIGPKNPSDWICVMNKTTKEQIKLKDALDKNKELAKEYTYYMKLQLFVKDKSVANDNNLYIIFLCTVDNRGNDFIKAPVGRKKPDAEYLKGLKRTYKMLTRPWTILDCTIEAVNTVGGQPIFFLVNTKLNLD